MIEHTQRLRIGRIPFANVFPIFHVLERDFDCSAYEFVDGVPSELNRMLREGTIDLSPSSSVEYLRNRDRYAFIPGISISSRGPVGSIFLFSRRPIEQLDGARIHVTSQSATSVALLRIILDRFYGLSCTYTVSGAPESEEGDAFLLIGDDALAYHKWFRTMPPEGMWAYDLGDQWHRRTGLPFVFALWIVRKEVLDPGHERHHLYRRFIADLAAARARACADLEPIARVAALKAALDAEEILEYWRILDYDLDEAHLRGLELFASSLPS
jgi:chorismate dehydratase